MSTKLRVGIVGAGFGQNVHLPAFRLLPDCEVVALLASSFEKTKALAQKLNIPEVYESWQELLEQGRLDILCISTLPGLQAEILAKALMMNLKIVAEKPLTLAYGQVPPLDILFQAKSPAIAVDFEFLELPIWQRTQTLLREGHIGQIQRAEVHWSMMTYANRHKLDSWKTHTQQGGGALAAFGSHVFYYLEELLGPIANLQAVITKDVLDMRETDTAVTVNGRCVNGAEIVVHIVTNRAVEIEHRLEFSGTKGHLRLVNRTDDYMQGFELLSAGLEARNFQILEGASALPGSVKDGRVFAVHSLLERWLQKSDKPMSARRVPDWRAGCRVQLLLECALKSSSTKCRVEVPETHLHKSPEIKWT